MVNITTLVRRLLLLVSVLLPSKSGFSFTPTPHSHYSMKRTSGSVTRGPASRTVSTPTTTTPQQSTTVLFSSSFKKTNNNNRKKEESTILPGIGPEGCRLPSPSRMNTLPLPLQATIFASVFAVLAIGTYGLSFVCTDLSLQYEWFQTWRTTWPILGLVYAAAGITHFTVQEEYENIVPPIGTWGIWYLPGSAPFHVQWTGVAELVGGVGLVIGGAIDALFAPAYFASPNTILSNAGLLSDSAALLCLLTVAVTPANIYMMTHGAKLPKDGPELPLVGHAVRGIFQIILLALLYQMGQGTFDAWLVSAS
jgi:uncharacterized membrane protein